MPGDQRVGGLRQLLERLAKLRGAGIAHRHRHVAEKAGILRAAHGARAKHLAELLLAQARQPVERGSHVDGLKSGLRRYRTTAVPRAHILTDVAAEDMVADFRAMLLGNRAAQL